MDSIKMLSEVIGNLFVQKVGININKKQKTH